MLKNSVIRSLDPFSHFPLKSPAKKPFHYSGILAVRDNIFQDSNFL